VKIAASYSKHLIDLMDRRDDLAVKVGDWRTLPKVEEVRRRFPRADILVHSSLILGSGTPVDQTGLFEELRQIVALARPPYLSGHIALNCQVDYTDEGKFVLGRRLAADVLIGNMKRNVTVLREELGLEVILENIPLVYTGREIPPEIDGCADPDFIRRAVEATDCDFLLDLAHARVSAAFLGLAVKDYLDALPVERAREFHLSGCREIDGMVSDEHEEMTAEDYALLDEVLKRWRPEFLTLEYSKDAAAVARQIERISEIAAAPPPG
jgi:uncharacterized protein (UPF0276 family)